MSSIYGRWISGDFSCYYRSIPTFVPLTNRVPFVHVATRYGLDIRYLCLLDDATFTASVIFPASLVELGSGGFR